MDELRAAADGHALPRRRLGPIAFAFAGGALAVAYAGLESAGLSIRLATGVWAVLAIGYGVLAHRPRHAEAWLLLAASVAVFQVADASDFGLPAVTRPGASDWISYAGYPLAAAGLVRMVRCRCAGRDMAGLLDAFVAAIALAYPAWVFLVDPFIAHHHLSPAVRVASILPPVGDLVLLGIIARLLVTTSSWSTSIWLLTAGVVVCATADTCEGLWRLGVDPWFGTGGGQCLVAAGWMGYCLLWGAAALVPSMRQNTVPAATRADLPPARIAMLIVAVLVVPAVAAAEHLSGHHAGLDALCAGTAVTLLVMSRIGLVLAHHRRALDHEQTLLAASESLASASGAGEVAAALRVAVKALFARNVPYHCVVAVIQEGTEEIAETAGGARSNRNAAHRPDPAAGGLTPAQWCAVLDAASADAAGLLRTRDLPPAAAEALGGPGQALAVPVANAADHEGGRRWRKGAIVIAGREHDLLTRLTPLEILARQTAMGLTRIELNREISRSDARRYFQTLVQHDSDAILIIGPDRDVRYASPSAEALFACPDLAPLGVEELLGPQNAAEITARLAEPATRAQVRLDWRVSSRGGHLRETEATISDLRREPTVAGLVISLRDVTEARRKDRELYRLAFQDVLTGLPNRAAFQGELEKALAARRPDDRLDVVMLDVDDFREINDAHGREVGDQVLRAAAIALAADLGPRDVLARVGPDEFALLNRRSGSAAAPPPAGVARGDRPLTVGPVTVTFSGAIIEGESGDTPARLLADAEITLHAAKQSGHPQTWRRYDPALHGELERIAVLRSRLARAVAADEFALVYQPIVTMADRGLSGFEALVRWPQRDGRVLGPDVFIPLAEATGHILPLGRWILRTATTQAAAWNRARERDGLALLHITVNVSALQLRTPDFARTVAEALESSGLDPGHLVIEATESVLIKGTDLAVENLRATAALGVGLALDDFGTGFSSLSYLQNLPVTGLKIDKSFVWGLEGSVRQRAIVEGIIGIGHSLALTIIAEGIETEDHCHALTRLGADRGQGYLFGKPMPPDQADTLICPVHKS